MSLSCNLFLRDDIANALASAYGTMLVSGGNGEFARGFVAALTAIAMALGIKTTNYSSTFQKQLKGGEE